MNRQRFRSEKTVPETYPEPFFDVSGKEVRDRSSGEAQGLMSQNIFLWILGFILLYNYSVSLSLSPRFYAQLHPRLFCSAVDPESGN